MSQLDNIISRKKEIRRIAEHFGAEHINLFGSVLQGRDTEGSDVDFLVSMKSECDLLDIIALSEALRQLLHRQVDVVTEDELSPYFRDEVLREAMAL